jgi:TRAP-type transport system small permease protein
MWLRKAAKFIEKIFSPLINMVSKIGSGVIVLIMLIMVSDVIGRRAFGQAILGTFELSQIMLVIVAFFNIGRCELFKDHITIGIVVSRFRKKTQDIIESTMYLFYLVIFALLTWQLGLYALAEQHRNSVISTILNIPVYPFVFVASFGCALLSLMVLMNLLLFLAGVVSREKLT